MSSPLETEVTVSQVARTFKLDVPIRGTNEVAHVVCTTGTGFSGGLFQQRMRNNKLWTYSPLLVGIKNYLADDGKGSRGEVHQVLDAEVPLAHLRRSSTFLKALPVRAALLCEEYNRKYGGKEKTGARGYIDKEYELQSKTWYNPQSHRRKYEETRVMLQLSSFKFNVAHQQLHEVVTIKPEDLYVMIKFQSSMNDKYRTGVDVKKGDGLTLYYDATGLRMPYPWFMAMTHSDEWESCMQWCERMLEHDLVGIATSGDLLVKTPGFPEEGELRDSPVTARRSMSPVWEQSSKTEEEQASECLSASQEQPKRRHPAGDVHTGPRTPPEAASGGDEDEQLQKKKRVDVEEDEEAFVFDD